MGRVVFAIVLGLVLGCYDTSQCDELDSCDECRSCATQVGASCRTVWRTCITDEACDSLVACIDDCWATLSDHAVVQCERTCRGTIGGSAVDLYDEYMGCVDDACTLSCAS